MTQYTSLQISSFSDAVYGYSAAVPQVVEAYGYALLVIAGADGEVSPAEMDWLIEYQRKHGASAEILASYRAFDYQDADLFQILSHIDGGIENWKTAAHLIYLAVHMAAADGEYAASERAKVLKAAKIMMVPDDVVLTVHCLVDMERGISNLRRALFHVHAL
jgi:uncharacterized tellurite resistance protein B-like protein